MVGAVLVKNGKVIGQGYHRKAGEPHAEALALERAGSAAKGATLYVTLEPCSHTGKRTPPCSPLVIKSGVKRVVVAMIDPNPRVSGGGVKALRFAGIRVETGLLEDEAKRLNEAFIKHITTGTPLSRSRSPRPWTGRSRRHRANRSGSPGKRRGRRGISSVMPTMPSSQASTRSSRMIHRSRHGSRTAGTPSG
jgi:riboflavin biosynthesis protein RibD